MGQRGHTKQQAEVYQENHTMICEAAQALNKAYGYFNVTGEAGIVNWLVDHYKEEIHRHTVEKHLKALRLEGLIEKHGNRFYWKGLKWVWKVSSALYLQRLMREGPEGFLVLKLIDEDGSGRRARIYLPMRGSLKIWKACLEEAPSPTLKKFIERMEKGAGPTGR